MSQLKLFNDQPYVPISMESRSHKILQLPNGVLVLLISDPTEDLAACSLSVSTGHHADPDDLPGLAHLCEHMVCVSSKEYPEIDLYKKKVYKAGGKLNAVTVAEKTTYFFEIPVNNDVADAETNEPMFNFALKVFASYFKHPLFNQGYIKREVVAVDNEHTKNCSALNRLSYHGLRLLSNSQHPFHRFCTDDTGYKRSPIIELFTKIGRC
ncbi:unnamed protein product [Ambrosiozyma monospora]|uniref:Unnamed protein product n=1 Tax=Ambrosiozyma monospora TaxID=43982 RepID=A0ACB5U3Z2_AMBMO|nr:unnamed protein product [Ambrosiozyma monospora]